MRKLIRIGITVLKIDLWGGKLLVVWSQIAFYGYADMSLLNEISDHKTDDLPPPMSILSAVIP